MSGPKLSHWGFTSGGISQPHFFGIRGTPHGLRDFLQYGHISAGPPAFPYVVTLKQIHSCQVVPVNPPIQAGSAEAGEGDALITDQPGVLLVVRTADCVPVLFTDQERGVIGAVHAGWRGILQGIVPETIEACIQRYQARIASMAFALGPSIGSCCYEIDAAVHGPLTERYPNFLDVLQAVGVGKWLLDLRKLVCNQILSKGVSIRAIEEINYCTFCRDEWFYSYRRDGKVRGTMLSGIMIPAA